MNRRVNDGPTTKQEHRPATHWSVDAVGEVKHEALAQAAEMLKRLLQAAINAQDFTLAIDMKVRERRYRQWPGAGGAMKAPSCDGQPKQLQVSA